MFHAWNIPRIPNARSRITSVPKPNARVFDLDREIFYEAYFREVPRVGELVRLYSYPDQSTGHSMPPLGFQYKVAQVLHTLTDYVENNDRSHTDRQEVTVYVRGSDDPLFR
jgi:hypothetical protein